MANIIRSAKSSSNWDVNELIAYNITVTAVPSQQFFPQEIDVPLTAAGLDPVLATADSDVRPDADVSRNTAHFLQYLQDATTPYFDVQNVRVPSIDDFARQVLITVGFTRGPYCVLRRRSIPLLICDYNRKVAQISVCLRDMESGMLLLLQMDKTQIGRSNVEACMIPGAIAAYQLNNNKRQERGLPSLDAMTMPCITMIETRPTFYLVPVTKALCDAVISCQYPSARTEVLKCEVASDHNGGMEAPEYRGMALQYYVAFKSLAKSHWEKFFRSSLNHL
ncbi:hypothetical protein EV424DRAFT_1523573 [Suillus variegatus]|nr:hypothetical protein EV424DRAFT_1523573 [Suillus variegatus]